MMPFDRALRLAALLAAGLGAAQAAVAGPPLICHPFVTDADAALLPWAEGRSWRLPESSYDVTRLVADTLKLLSPDAPVLSRMENMRRATIYADGNREIASELLHAVLVRTQTTPADARQAALEWFDLGFLVETYRQLAVVYDYDMLPGKEQFVTLVPADLAQLDGYALVQKALALAPEAEAELQFAASLIAREQPTSMLRARAAAAAPARSSR